MRIIDQKLQNLNRFFERDIDNFISHEGKDKRKKINELIIQAISSRIDEIFELIPRSKEGEEGALLKTGIDNVSFRIKTFTSIVDSLSQHLVETTVVKSLSQSGINSGINFSMDIFNYFWQKIRIPANYESFIAFWMKYDSSAGFGVMSIEELDLVPDGYMKIRINDSFLVRGYSVKSHRYCSFIKGYLHGLLYCGFHRCFQILKTAQYITPKFSLYPVESNHEEVNKKTCFFSFKFIPDPFPKAHESLFWALEAFRIGEFQVTMIHIKTAFELSIKEKLGIPVNLFVSFHRIMSFLGNISGVEMEFLSNKLDPAKKAYLKANKFVINDKKPRKQLTENILNTTIIFLFYLSQLRITKKHISEIMEKLIKVPEFKNDISIELQYLKETKKNKEKTLSDYKKEKERYGFTGLPKLLFLDIDSTETDIDDLNKQIAELKKQL